MDLDKFFVDNPDWRPFADLVAIPPLPEEMMREYTDVSSEMLARCMEFVTEGGGFVTRGAIYLRVRREDKRTAGDKWATMLALNAFPGINTTDTFWAGRKTWVQCFGEDYANRVKRGLAARGINLKSGDEYMPELVRPGYGPNNPDPEAVVPFGGARSYIKKLCEKRGWACHGATEAKHRQPDSDPLADENCVPLAPDLVKKLACKMVRKNPELRRKTKAELREMVLEKHGPSKVKGRIVKAPSE